jgi:hypothetical protein
VCGRNLTKEPEAETSIISAASIQKIAALHLITSLGWLSYTICITAEPSRFFVIDYGKCTVGASL